MIKKGIWILTMALACGWNINVQSQTIEPLAMPVVEEDSIMKHITELSSETYEGRLAGTRGYNEAVAYVERVLRSYGVSVSEQLFEVECNEVETASSTFISPARKTVAPSFWVMTSAARA